MRHFTSSWGPTVLCVARNTCETRTSGRVMKSQLSDSLQGKNVDVLLQGDFIYREATPNFSDIQDLEDAKGRR